MSHGLHRLNTGTTREISVSTSDRVVKLRDGEIDRYLTACVDELGQLHLDGEDFGSAIDVIPRRDSDEWFQTIAADDVPRVVELLGGQQGEDILELLKRDYTGPRADELERRPRESHVAVKRHAI